jgi:hypothetical protein
MSDERNVAVAEPTEGAPVNSSIEPFTDLAERVRALVDEFGAADVVATIAQHVSPLMIGRQAVAGPINWALVSCSSLLIGRARQITRGCRVAS